MMVSSSSTEYGLWGSGVRGGIMIVNVKTSHAFRISLGFQNSICMAV